MPSAALILANAINPVLAGSLVGSPWVTPRMDDPTWRYWARAAVGISAAVLLAEAGKRFSVWPGHPTFPSGHETFALATATFLVRRDHRWLVPVVPLLLLLAWALVAAHFHHPVDVAGALLSGIPAAWLCDWWLGPRPARS